jgi:hypothetical protein
MTTNTTWDTPHEEYIGGGRLEHNTQFLLITVYQHDQILWRHVPMRLTTKFLILNSPNEVFEKFSIPITPVGSTFLVPRYRG